MLVFLLFFQSFGSVKASAASDNNLVDSDLTQWESDNPVTQVTERVINGDTCYFIFSDSEQIADTNLNMRYSLVYEIPDLKVGRSYTFNFHLLSAEEVGSANVYGETALYTGYKNGSATMCIGLGSYDASIGWVNFVDNAYIEINKDNYLSYYGTDISIQFELPNIVNPCIFIYYADNSTSKIDNWAYFKNIELIDNSQADEDSFFSRLFEWFQEKFDAIGESFSNLGNKLTDLKNSFVNKITDLKDSFVLKLEELKQGILNLGDIIIEGIQGLFTPDEAYILQWKANLQQLLEDNLGIIYTCGDLFITMIQEAFSIISDSPDTYEIKIPEVSFEANGTRVPVFTSQTIDFSFMEKPVFRTMYSMYTVALYIFFGGLEVRYALRVKNKVMSN